MEKRGTGRLPEGVEGGGLAQGGGGERYKLSVLELQPTKGLVVERDVHPDQSASTKRALDPFILTLPLRYPQG